MDITQKVPNLLELPELVFGAEGDEGTPTGAATDSSSEGQEGAGGASDDASSDAEDHDDEQHDDADDPKVKGLKSALAAERRRANAAEKAAKTAAKEKAERELAEKSEIERLQIKEQAANEKLQKLSDGYRNSAIDRAIEKAAADFVDPTDAIAGVDRKLIEVEQDDEDPSIVKVDQKSVTRLVKELSARKPHFLKKPGTDDGEPTGSGFGGTKKTRNSETEEQALRKKYRI